MYIDKWTVTRDAHTIHERNLHVFMTSILSLFSAVERAVNRFLLCFVVLSSFFLRSFSVVSNMKSGFSLLIKFQECFKNCPVQNVVVLGSLCIYSFLVYVLKLKRKQNTHKVRSHMRYTSCILTLPCIAFEKFQFNVHTQFIRFNRHKHSANCQS